MRTILRDICRDFPPDRLRRELRRALYCLMSVTENDREAEVREALQSIQDEFLPVKENIVTLLEHLEKCGEKRGEKLGRVGTLVRLLSASFAEFSEADAERVRDFSDAKLDELADAIALRRTWAEIEPILRQSD